jgi:cytochrome c oxidase assembly factor 4
MSSGHEKHVSTSTDDEPDEWDERIERGGCAQEHFKLQDCYMASKDWRKCKGEVDPSKVTLIQDGSIQGMLGSESEN